MTDVSKPTESPAIEIQWTEVAPALLRAKGITSGLWRFGLRLRFAAINMGDPTTGSATPTSLVAVQNMTIQETTEPGPLVFDASTGKEVTGAMPLVATTPAAKKRPPKPRKT